MSCIMNEHLTIYHLQNNNPYISAQVNDGSRNFDHQTDGSQHAVGGCMRDYRNKPYPVKAKIRYENNVLTVSVCRYYKKRAWEQHSHNAIFTGISRNTQSKSYALSLTVWEFKSSALWDTHEHALLWWSSLRCCAVGSGLRIRRSTTGPPHYMAATKISTFQTTVGYNCLHMPFRMSGQRYS